ncbi:peptidylprolyl isomerase [Cognatiyoonia sp. IB215182]|uniref:peptidylprolyl isomerase n=1 Tax=Cognatiyoonia sp. IB215182 TaxID=3097353 RepID=UPI002A0F17BC|nr:peptidylprolyl isomerase [Cognatiyoonia sp. IB215182]MDX8352108.1 peptidylprolyl isomerase [Cognatiyoonia sp. IB215182]
MRAFGLRAALLAMAATIGFGSASLAQGQLTPAITVNDRVITQFELSQRVRLLDVFNTTGDLNEIARNGLIEDRLKQQEMDRVGLEISEEALQAELEAFAQRGDLSLPQFLQVLAQNGVQPQTLRDFVEVGVTWRQYIRARFGRQVNVTDADVERAIAAQSGATSELQVLLNEIIIAAPPDRAARALEVAEIISDFRTFAEFEDAARQVSALPSRDNGGRLGWLPITNYPPQIRAIILDLEPGEVTEPLSITNGIALFQLRGTREAALPVTPPVSIDYAAYYIPGGRSEAALRAAAQIRNRVDTCDDLYGVARGQPAEVLDRVSLPPSDIASDIALELARLDRNEVSTNLTRNNGNTLVFLMLCDRVNAGQGSANPDTVRNQIRSQRLTALADALLEDLRASAVIRN